MEVWLRIGGETEVWVIEIRTTQNLWFWNGTASIFRYNVDFRISIPQTSWLPSIIPDGTECGGKWVVTIVENVESRFAESMRTLNWS